MIAQGIGILCFAAALAAASYAIVVYARRQGLLAPVLVGAGLRLGVLLMAHAGTVALGDGGLMFLDDATYATAASEIAEAWRAGDWVYPGAHDLAGSYQFGYPTLVAGVFFLVGDHVVVAKLLNVLFGAATILVTALIVEQVLGRDYARRGAWLAALAPGLIWWTTPLLKEALATFLVAVAVLAMLRLPRLWGALVATLVALVVVRASSVIVLLGCLGVALVLAARRAGVSLSPRVLAFSALGLLAGVGAVLTVFAAGNPVQLVEAYVETVQSSIEAYRGGVAFVPADAVKSLVTPLPWTFDAATASWNRGLYPGMWFWYMAYALAAMGAWRLRHRPELALLALPILLTVLLNSFTGGFEFRQRSVVEPLVVVLACAGIASWREALQIGAVAIGAVAAVAAVQANPATGLAIAAAAAGLFVAARWVPATNLRRDLPPSPLETVVTSLGGGLRALAMPAVTLRRKPLTEATSRPASNERGPLVTLLRCLSCAGELEIVAAGPAEVLRCRSCAQEYPVAGGIPRMLQPQRDSTDVRELKKRTGESFAYEWERFGAPRAAWARNFRDYMRPHPPEFLRGKLVLDVGTGSGRHSLEAHRAGARVVAVDIGRSIETARRNLPDDVLAVQADAERLPFAPETFDFVMSIGVLHHLPDTERALRRLLPFARRGGYIHAYLYWAPPRRWHRAALRGVAAARRLTTRMPHRLLHPACYPLAAVLFVAFVMPQRLARGRRLEAKLQGALPLSAYVDYPFGVLVNDTFDRLSAPLERRFSEAEVRLMFESAGLEDVTVIPNNGWVASGRRPRDD